MKRWYFGASILLAFAAPIAVSAQQGFGGGTQGTGAGTGRGTGSGSSSGLAGTANTTLLGNSVNLNFNSVFGTSATLANTTADPFATYRPSGTSSGSSGTAFSGGTGTSGFGAGGTGLGTGTGGVAGGLGNTTGARTGTGLTGTGLGNAGGLGGNRNTLGGGNLGGGLGGNRMGGGNIGGGGFLGGAGGFLGGAGNMNSQQGATAATGYIVNFDGKAAGSVTAATTTISPNADFQQRLTSAPGLQGLSNLQVFTRGETAILRGQVNSDYAKQLAAAMIRLEPGVYQVENELTVVPAKQ